MAALTVEAHPVDFIRGQRRMADGAIQGRRSLAAVGIMATDAIRAQDRIAGVAQLPLGAGVRVAIQTRLAAVLVGVYVAADLEFVVGRDQRRRAEAGNVYF